MKEAMVRAQVKVEELEMEDPMFEGGASKTARATLTNPTAKEFTYTTELYLGVTKVVTSGIGSVTIPANSSLAVDYTVIMPLAEAVYEVYLDVWYDTELLKHYKAIENVTIEISPAVTVGPIIWV